ncbi:Uncharacterised protein [Vibrio cholerae]|nr:Uncharacterised protein [Vibrio cholerae]CSI53790.1 Uncharacterised protein [Vibrio cholerae]
MVMLCFFIKRYSSTAKKAHITAVKIPVPPICAIDRLSSLAGAATNKKLISDSTALVIPSIL